tara:strand:+ start:1099 stop:1518 length:420 start_codon:yes stop_codon:yes gene_type:complete
MLANKVKAHFGDELSVMTFAIWGLSFKSNTEDVREAPAGVIIDELRAAGPTLKAYDPVAMKEAKEHYIFDKVTYCKDAYDALVDADALLLVTEGSEFRIPRRDVVGKLLKNKAIFDGSNIYDRKYLKTLDFEVYSIGSK